jgi:putative transposase
MARLARLVVPDIPHHVTQRGNGRAQTFFSDDDYRFYRDLLAESCRAADVEVWAWVLMPNHVHLVLTPADQDGLRRALAPVHRRYAAHIHDRTKQSGHFWQGRFGAVAMDDAHLAAAIRYIALNPVRARLVDSPEQWPWSSLHAHLSAKDDGITKLEPVLSRYPDFAEFIAAAPDTDGFDRLRKAESIGRPLGDTSFIESLESMTGRILKAGKRGRLPGARFAPPE